ncbi:MAG: hypothetical protein LBL96_10175 [Clostridiales bacterium]|nr:hypothetical protein [Clostridiales bacterium]
MIHDNESGASLWEVLIALSIAVILIAATTAPLVNTEKRELYNAALALQQDIRYTRELALINAKSYRIQVSETSYKIFAFDEGSKHAAVIYLANGVKAEFHSDSNFDFKPYGTPSVSNKITLRSRNGKYAQEVRILPVSGRVAIYPAK